MAEAIWSQMNKNRFIIKKVVKYFGGSKKMCYLCTAFREVLLFMREG